MFTLFMLVSFERTVAWQRVHTLMGRCFDRAVYDTMLSDRKWDKVLTDELLPGDVDALGEWLYLLKEFLY